MRLPTLITLIGLMGVAILIGTIGAWTEEDKTTAAFKSAGAIAASIPIVIALLGLANITRFPSLIPGATLGIATLLFSWAVIFWLIFMPDSSRHGPSSNEDKWGMTLGTVAVTMTVAVSAALLSAYPKIRLAGAAAVGFCLAAQLCFLGGIWGDDTGRRFYNPMSSQWFETGSIILSLGIVTSICLLGRFLQKEIWEWIIMPAGTLVGLVSIILGITYTWRERIPMPRYGYSPYGAPPLIPRDDFALQHAFQRTAIAVGFFALLMIISQLNFRGLLNIVRIVTAAITFAFSLMFFILTFYTQDYVDRDTAATLARWVTYLGFLSGFLILATAGIWLAMGRKILKIVPAPYSSFQRACPRCGEVDISPSGASSCNKCGLRMKITFEEATCNVCGHILYMNRSPRCPECGAPAASILTNDQSPVPSAAPPAAYPDAPPA